MNSPVIRIVLVAPSHPGNIGAAARAMKNMGLRELVLVRPRHFPDPEASARASGADDVLASARVVESLQEALSGCGFVAATTSRERDQYFRIADVRDAAVRVLAEAQRSPAAVVFGAERTGLTNEELETAHLLIRIPASDAYASLNLAMAVQLVAYELFRARGVSAPVSAPRRSPPRSRCRDCSSISRRCWTRSTSAIAPKAARTSCHASAASCSARNWIRTSSTSCAAF